MGLTSPGPDLTRIAVSLQSSNRRVRPRLVWRNGEQRDFVRRVIEDGLLQIILTLPQLVKKARKEKSLENCESSLRQWESFSSATDSAGILTFSRVRTFDPLELGEWVFGNRLQLITAPTSNSHGGLWRWQLIHSPCKSGLNS